MGNFFSITQLMMGDIRDASVDEINISLLLQPCNLHWRSMNCELQFLLLRKDTVHGLQRAFYVDREPVIEPALSPAAQNVF